MELSLRLQLREISLQEGLPEDHHYASNRVTTGTSTLHGYIAAIAGHQATRLASWWFLIVAVAAMNPLNLDYTATALPLALLLVYLALVLARETAAAWDRRAVDKESNDEVASVWTGQSFEQVAFSKVRVGQCVLVRETQRFPADVVLLASSQKNGTCVVTTASVLGESDTSVKVAVKELQRILPTMDSPLSFIFSRLNVLLRVDPPSPDFHSFQGRMTIKTLPRASVLDLSHLVLRGSVLHSKWALGLAVYTGMETKVWLGRSRPAHKLSVFSKGINVWTAATALVVLAVTGLLVLVQNYVSVEEVQGEDTLLYFLCFSGAIPVAISLGLNISRALLLWRYHREIPGTVFKSGTFSEDLANVRYVLMDKTGTVTTNQLEVTQVIIEDSVYIRCEEKPQTVSVETSNRQESQRFPCSMREKSDFTFRDLQEKMRLGLDPSLRRLYEAMTLCNGIDPADASSLNREEVAIAEAVKEMGGGLSRRDEEECEVEMFENTVRYRVLAMRKFSQELGRVRILLQEENDSEATLYVKGTYPAVKDLLSLSSEERLRLELRLEGIIKNGMRPVVLCYRPFTGDALETVRLRAQSAHISQLNSDGKTEILLKEIEKDLSFLAIVGLTDKVAAEVKECVQLLDLCGVDAWLLSGDTETNTLAGAYSLGLLRPSVKLVRLSKVAPELCGRKLLSIAKDHVFMKHGLPNYSAETPRSYFENAAFLNWSEATPDSFEFALSIDGITLSGALQDHATRRLLACLLYSASFACFNRLLPSHKRELVKLLKHGLGARPIVLGIGDDGSNVAMLLEADVGIGVFNAQDSRAVNTSDLAVSGFAVLCKVLLAARENYELLSKVALLFIYSTSLLHLLQLAYVLVAAVTPTPLFPLDLTVYYNTLLCLFLFVGFGLTHRSHCTPEKYGFQRNTGLTWTGVRQYLLLTLGHACLLLALLSLALLAASSLASEEITVTVLLSVVLTVNQHCWQEASSWGFLPFSLVSIGAAFAYCAGSANLSPALAHVFAQPCLVLGVFLSPLACTPLSTFFVTPYLLRRRSNAVMPIGTQSSFMRRLQRESKVILDLYHASRTTSAPETAEGSNFEIEPRVVKFRSRETEEEYIAYFLLNSLPLLRFALLLTVLQICLAIRREAVQHPADIPFLSLALVGTVGLLGASWLTWPFLTLMQGYSVLFLILIFVLDLLTATVRSIAYTLAPIGLLLIAREHWTSNIYIVTFSSLLICIDSAVYLTSSARNWENIEEIVGGLIVYFMITVIAAVTAYRHNYSNRARFQLCKETERRMVQNENILSFLLPDFVRRQVKDGFRYIAEDKDSVSVLFCEICHFDSIVAAYSPIDLTELLDDVFHQIDELCVTLGVAKIETVGKVYMACTGLSDFESELASDLQAVPHTQRALELAFAILTSFKNYRLQTGALLQFKIGIHTGSVIAGVVGYTKPQFSLVGDTVNTASRMSTTAPEPNTIQVSDSTFQELKATATLCEFTVRTVQMKGKGEQTVYLAKEVAGVSKTRRRTGSEDASVLRGKSRHRSSIVASLRESLEIQEAFEKDSQKQREQMQWLPCAPVSALEEQFRRDNASRHLQDLRLGLHIYMSGLVLRLAVEFRLDTETAVVPGALFALALGMNICLRVRLEMWSERRWLPWYLISTYVVVGLGLCAEYWLAGVPMLTTLEVVLTLVLMHYCSGLLFQHVLLGSVGILAPWIVICISREPNFWEYAVFSLLFAIQHCIHKYFDERNERLLFSLSELAASEIEKTERLLAHMLPGHAYESLKLEEWVSDRLSQVTLLFADVSGFTAWASVHTPQEVVTYLSTIYACFDKECTRLGLYKVHTIGDCYVAMSATNNNDLRDPGEECKRMLCLAQAMIEELQDQAEALNMRIGVHCGDVIACITGSQVIRYDIYGNDVLIANRMESCGVPGRVNVSEDVKSLMEMRYPTSFFFTPNQEVRIEDIQRSLHSFFLASV